MDIRLIPGIIIVNLFIKDKEFISNKNFRQFLRMMYIFMNKKK